MQYQDIQRFSWFSCRFHHHNGLKLEKRYAQNEEGCLPWQWLGLGWFEPFQE
jgi:hypothetical protein